MKLFTPIFALFAIIFFSTSDAQACKCSSGCGMITQGLSSDVLKLVQEGNRTGHSPLSCIRTQACQDRLRHCYERCGQYGRAARKSKHSDGTACDWMPDHGRALKQIESRNNLRNIRRLVHSKGQGSGLHEYTIRYTKAPQGGGQPAQPVQPSQPAQPVQPAGGGDVGGGDAGGGDKPRQPAGNSGGHEQLANGKYKCARGMKSICGSTIGTRWCKSWVASGHTPGCY
ncbi:MAG TPA: hypothetical protein VIH99_03875 [Bdellovibrionota bacterium]|jgi:hypothetical protein